MKMKIFDVEVLEVWESFNGDLYFVTEKADDRGYAFGYVRMYSMPQFAEFGGFNINGIDGIVESYGKYKIWIVKKQNWSNLKSYDINGLSFEKEVRV